MARAVAARFVSTAYANFGWQFETNRLLFALHAAQALQEVDLKVSPEIKDTLRRAMLRPKASITNTSPLLSFAFADEGKRLATVDLLGNVSLWDGASGEFERSFLTGSPAPTFCIFSADTSHVLGVWSDSTGVIYSVSSSKEVSRVWGLRASNRRFDFQMSQTIASVSPGGQHVAFVGQDGVARVQTIHPVKLEPKQLPTPSDSVARLIFNPNGRSLAVLRREGTIGLYDVQSGTEISNPAAATNSSSKSVRAIAWSSDGQRLVGGDSAGAVTIWRVPDLSIDRVLKQEATTTKGSWIQVAFDDDGFYVGAFSSDGSVTIWDAWRGDVLFHVPIDMNNIGFSRLAPVFSPDLQSVALLQGNVLQLYELRDVKDPVAAALTKVAASSRTLFLEDYARAPSDIQPTLQESVVLARSNKVTNAIALLLSVTNLPGVRFDPTKEVIRLAVSGLMESGDTAARDGRVKEAVDSYQQAKALNPMLAIEPEARAKQLASESAIEQAKRWASAGDTNKACEFYRRARAFDPALDEAKIRAEVRQIQTDEMYRRGLNLIDQNKIAEAIEAFREVSRIDPTFQIPVYGRNQLCWIGSLSRFATNVFFACEEAVNRATNSDTELLTIGAIRDSRGLARALTGEVDGAIEDFEAYIKEGITSSNTLNSRLNWVRRLRAKEKPEEIFTPKVLNELRTDTATPFFRLDDAR